MVLETIRPVEVSLEDPQHRMRMLNHSCRRNLYFAHGKTLFFPGTQKSTKKRSLSAAKMRIWGVFRNIMLICLKINLNHINDTILDGLARNSMRCHRLPYIYLIMDAFVRHRITMKLCIFSGKEYSD